MKFRISPKDLVIFIIFCIFLLYLCAIAVLNFSSFGTTMTFYGLNPIEAFSLKYLPLTLVMFAVVLIIIFSSVSSYIFDKEKGKGVGLTVKKKEDNEYARFATDKEMKNAFGVKRVMISDEQTDAAGVVLKMDKKEWYVDNSENHTLVIGATASGKTTSVVNPLVISLAKKGESMILTDPKGEIYKEHCAMLKEKGYNVIVLNFRDPGRGSAWNPLSLPYRLFKEGNSDKATELLDDVASNILKDDKAQDPFWQNSAADFFAGCALGLFEDGTEEEANISSITAMANQGFERFATSQYIKEYFTMKGEASSPYIFASNLINSPKDTQGGQLATFREKLRKFAGQKNLSEMLSYTDFDMRDIGNEKSAVFIVIQDEKTTYHALATIFIKQLYETLIDVAYKEKNGRLKFRTNFILDEFANMPPLKDVTSMVTAARSRDIRFTFIIQNFAQLKDVYGENDALTIRSNCGNMIYLLTTELAALEEISKLAGMRKPKDKDKPADRPLISVTDLQKMKMNEVIIMRSRMNPYKTKLVPSFNLEGLKHYEKSEFYTRPTKTVKVFNLKEFVKEEKRKQMEENMKNPASANAGGGNPMMGGAGMFGLPSMGASPLAGGFNPGVNPFASNASSSPFGNPFKTNPSLGMPNAMSQMNTPMDIDAMIKDIDAKIAEIEKEERENKNRLAGLQNPGENKSVLETMSSVNNSNNFKQAVTSSQAVSPLKPDSKTNMQLSFENLAASEKNNTHPDVSKPKINVDKDSVIVDEHIVSDDEFFDDFFGE